MAVSNAQFNALAARVKALEDWKAANSSLLVAIQGRITTLESQVKALQVPPPAATTSESCPLLKCPLEG